ncbi:MAG: hypothetical protein RBS55_10705 [Bacteroidales bacterium]|jgi:hypothetical protein|nr:hypothetical protein [Bacteroidales bacterium]
MPDISSYVQYFEKLASEHKDILHSPTSRHFFMMDINELLSATNSTARYPAIVMLKLSGKAIDKKEDNRLITIEGGFLVLDHCKNIDDFAAELEIFQKTFAIGMQMISRIAYDRQQPVPYSSKAIPDFNPDSVRWEMIGPVFENHFGIIFRFPVNLIAEMEYDSEKWI